MNNCHGCKWLDRYKEDGRGYCCHVERSKETNKDKQRLPSMERCELYEAGEFKFRYDWLKNSYWSWLEGYLRGEQE